MDFLDPFIVGRVQSRVFVMAIERKMLRSQIQTRVVLLKRHDVRCGHQLDGDKWKCRVCLYKNGAEIVGVGVECPGSCVWTAEGVARPSYVLDLTMASVI